ncbi:MAG: FHA domain-containing protein, partial [Holophagales bacterium]|nr:FHA domain-containing protein [Holophagales bacterium]
MHRLVAYAQNGVQRFNVDRSEMVIGSDRACDIHLPFAGVGKRHARLVAEASQLSIEDLGGSRKGVMVNGQKVREAALQVLDEIRLGSIALLLEDVVADKGGDENPEPRAPPEPTITAGKLLEHLARVSQWVLSDASSSITLESLVTDLLEDFGGGVLFLFQGEPETRGIKLVVATEARWLGRGEELLSQVMESQGGKLPDPGPEVTALDGALEGAPAWIAHRTFMALDRPYLFVLAL